jgi:hypothetical protein
MSDVNAQILFDGNGNAAVKHVQDVEPILEHNKELRSQEQQSDWGRHIAEIPNVIMVRWLDEEHAKGRTDLRLYSKEFDQLIAKKLKDPDWAYLRTDKPALITGWMGFGS